MSEAIPSRPSRSENDTIDWRALADELFPADALRMAPAAYPLVMFSNVY